MPNQMKNLTGAAPEGKRIILLDLVWTLAHRRNNQKEQSYEETIRKHEEYRGYLIDSIPEEAFIVLLTARSEKYRGVVLQNLDKKLEWSPDVALFCELIDAQPPTWKNYAVKKYLIPKFGNDMSRYFAIEANGQTRAMYDKMGIPNTRWEAYYDLHRDGKNPLGEGLWVPPGG